MPFPNDSVRVGVNGGVSTDGADIALVLKMFLRNVGTRDVRRAYCRGKFCDEPAKTLGFHETKKGAGKR